MNQAQLKGVQSDSIHWKLESLWKSATRDGELVCLRLDPVSRRDLLGSAEAMNDGSLSFSERGEMWRGMPIVLEMPAIPMTLVSLEASIPEDAVKEPECRIITIEGKDSRSGRTLYTNFPSNPEGYR